MYQHHNWHGTSLDYPVSKVVCVGSNYANHIKETGGNTPEEPVLFIKPEVVLCDLCQPLVIPSDVGSVHHEAELAVLVGATLRQAMEGHMRKAIAGYGVALDLTLCDIQGGMKKAGQPWERVKGFDNSCLLSGSILVTEFNGDLQDTILGLMINGEPRQHGTTADMIHRIVPLIVYVGRFFTLKAGNVVLTGTPADVGPLNGGDELAISFHGQTLMTRVLQSLLAAFSDDKTCISVSDWL